MYDMSALYQAQSVQDAIRLRLEHPEAQIIAGGTDVLVQMREGKRAGKALISIQGCREMRGVSLDEEENLRIGSLTTFSHITADPLIQRYIKCQICAVLACTGKAVIVHGRGTGMTYRRANQAVKLRMSCNSVFHRKLLLKSFCFPILH